MKFTFQIRKDNKITSRIVEADTVPMAWEKIKGMIEPQNDIALHKIGKTIVGELLEDYTQ